jgi:hypothetical protein
MSALTTSRRERLICQLTQITDIVGMEDLTVSELESVVELLEPAHIRVLAGHKPFALRLVQCDELDG